MKTSEIMTKIAVDTDKNYLQNILENSGITDVFIYKKLEIAKSTFWIKKKEAHTFTLSQIVTLGEILRMPYLEIIQNIVEEKEQHPERYVLKN